VVEGGAGEVKSLKGSGLGIGVTGGDKVRGCYENRGVRRVREGLKKK